MNGITIALLRGGPSSEYEISMQTGAGVLDVLAKHQVQIKDIIISKQGEWLYDGFVCSPQRALAGVDVAFIALHGSYGEDSTVQRILELNHIPYTGSEPFASALAMNKILAKEHIKELGIKMPKHMRVNQSAKNDLVQVAHNIAELFGPEYFVKPINGGSSIDTQIAYNSSELTQILQRLLTRYESVMVEERIKGREATVGIIENFRDQRHYLMPVVEIVPPSTSDFFAADVKYTGATDEICPGRFNEKEKTELHKAAESIHKTLGLRHYSRSDFIVASHGVYFLEINTLPGLTKQSLFPKAIESVGSSYAELIAHLIHLANK